MEQMSIRTDWLGLLLVGAAFLAALVPGCRARPTAPRPSVAPLLRGMGAEVDPMFPYYADRSAASIASEVKANGYTHVHYVVTADADLRADLVKAFRDEGLPVWYATFCNVAYSTKDFPPGWEAWRMVLRASPGNDFTRLCMNDPGYTAFKKRRITEVMRRFPFDGVEVMEPFWPDTPGPEKDTYGCLCEDCRAAFLRDYPEETDIPEFTDASSPRYYKRDQDLYRKWVEFRVRSIGRFLDAVLADVRHKPVLAWTLVQMDVDGVALMREAQGMDAAALVKTLRPEAVVFQTNWTDWMKPVLPPTYLEEYRPFVEHLRGNAPGMPFTFQVDTGSFKESRRTMEWLRTADRTAQRMGALGTVNYEYFITQSMYDDPPRLMEVRPRRGGIALVFQKRVDAGRAADPGNYRVTGPDGAPLKLTGVKADGNMVLLGVRGLVPGRRHTVTVQEIRDTPERWLFKGYPAHTVRNLRKTFTLGRASGS